MTDDQLKAKVFSLMARYCQLGRLLDEEGIEAGEPAALTSAKVVLAEMNKTKGEIDEHLDRVRVKYQMRQQ
jgi:hypothetical protein